TNRHTPSMNRHRSGPAVIGWVGSPTTAPYLHLIDAPLATACKGRDVSVRIVGGPYRNEAIPRLDVRSYDLERETDELPGMDIGILPEPDDEWTKGKGAFKALLYMATALPVVASDVGVNREVVGPGGMLATGEAEWRRALEHLIDDPGYRRELGD